MDYEVQVVSGVFQLSMGDGFIQRYDRVQNVVVRISNRNTENKTASCPAILVNAHFDSVPQVSIFLARPLKISKICSAKKLIALKYCYTKAIQSSCFCS